MESNQNSILGRKVFFLNLSADVKERLINALRKDEYEVFALEDYRYSKNVLEAYPDSIFFLQIDEHDKNILTINQWFNFLYSFKETENLNSLILGVISRRMTTPERNFFMLNLPLNGGVLAIRNATGSVLTNILEVLDLNGAKGRRQYVRARCPKDTTDYLKCNIQGMDFTLRINDISCVGISCYVPVEQAQFFQPNAVLKNMVLGLGMDKPITCNAAIFAVKPLNEKFSLLVCLLLPTTSEHTKDLIRNHVYDVLQNEIDGASFSKPMDEENYPDKLPPKNEQGFIIDENDSDEDEEESAQ